MFHLKELLSTQLQRETSNETTGKFAVCNPTPVRSELQSVIVWCGLALWWVDLDEVLQITGVAGERAAAVGLYVRIDAAVTKDEARGGQHCGVCAKPPAQRACRAVGAELCVFGFIGWDVLATVLLLQMDRGWRSRQGGKGLHSALVVWGVPPLKELQEKDAQRQWRGQGQGRAPSALWHQPQRSLHQAANKEYIVGGQKNVYVYWT